MFVDREKEFEVEMLTNIQIEFEKENFRKNTVFNGIRDEHMDFRRERDDFELRIQQIYDHGLGWHRDRSDRNFVEAVIKGYLDKNHSATTVPNLTGQSINVKTVDNGIDLAGLANKAAAPTNGGGFGSLLQKGLNAGAKAVDNGAPTVPTVVPETSLFDKGLNYANNAAKNSSN